MKTSSKLWVLAGALCLTGLELMALGVLLSQPLPARQLAHAAHTTPCQAGVQAARGMTGPIRARQHHKQA